VPAALIVAAATEDEAVRSMSLPVRPDESETRTSRNSMFRMNRSLLPLSLKANVCCQISVWAEA
jgi:hypothetical protein